MLLGDPATALRIAERIAAADPAPAPQHAHP